ncbi:PD-(D/E)XK nuclease family protein [Flammeovirga agarivorans]|uniref:PD-(D/E)XK endonuclease-like domain-containing protein n=1 Tax=Flammeovirga agarivorans TaxID=2726742 RepID=A0A7X8XVG0_9BACT|nr:PD-(D/E)XK nuclease family protein [Flammeovirga agarivorans]NLR91261.1 hypothetical protein [Flammeovirga agarivorans]
MSQPYQIPFLQTVAQKILDNHSGNLNNILVVLPSRRAGMYFKQYFGNVITKVTIAPPVLSMEGFAERFSKLVKADNVTLLFELYKVYKEENKDITIEKFAPLGKSLLSEFNMIDNNMTEEEAQKMFEHLNESKAIDHWAEGLSEEEAESFKKNWKNSNSSMTDFLAFWQNLSSSYTKFKASLAAKGIAYGGMLFREAYDHLAERINELGIDKVIFAGFSQMSGIEQSIVQYLTDLGKAQTYFDTDKRYHHSNKKHEAGYYLRRYVNGFAAQHHDYAVDQFSSHEKKVNFKAVSSIVGEVKFAGEWLASLLDTPDKRKEFVETLNHTAILLPDETVLPALLKSLPDIPFENGKTLAELTNITMGMSYEKTPFFDLITEIFKLKERVIFKDGQYCAYFKNVQNILRHPFFNSNYREIDVITGSILEDITKKNYINVPLDYLVEASGSLDIFKVVFKNWGNDYVSYIEHFQELINALLEMFKDVLKIEAPDPSRSIKISDSTFSYEEELLSILYDHLKHLYRVLPAFFPEKKELPIFVFKTLLMELLRGTKVPFTGVPIAPLQIMGMLESRALDFKNVLILSCNEGILPTKKSVEAIIPFDVRAQYGLPTYQDKNAAFAYTFYRLFHRSENLMFSYLDANAGNDIGEMSRLLLQVKEEMLDDPQFRLTTSDTSAAWMLAKADKTMGAPVEIVKSDVLKEKILRRLKRGVSPSAINSFIRNPLTFIDEKVIDLKEEDEIEEDLDNRSFGNLIHLSLEWGLRRMAGLDDKDENTPFVLRKEDFDKALKDKEFIPNVIQAAALEEKVELVKGQNLLLKAVAENLLQRYFKKQIEEIEKSTSKAIGIIGLEKYVTHNLKVDVEGEEIEIRLSGMADRIDVIDGQLRVVDYKSGGYQRSDMDVSDWNDILEDDHKGKFLQLSLYQYLLTSASADKSNEDFHKLIGAANRVLVKNGLPEVDLSLAIKSGFYFFRKINDGLIVCKEGQPIGGEEMEFLPKTEKLLENWTKRLLDTSSIIEDVI